MNALNNSRGGAACATIAVLVACGGALAQQQVQYRSVDGFGNNPQHPSWGVAGGRYLREASGAHYADGHSLPPGAARPSARAISNVIVDQGPEETDDERGLSVCMYEFGQFLDHDIGLAGGGTTESFHIPVPMGDPWFDPLGTGTQVIPLKRSAAATGTGVTNSRQQVNTVTAFIDASMVYGSDAIRAAWLRTGSGGHLKMQQMPFGDMLPYNDGTMPNDNPLGLPVTSLYVAGDVRSNEQPGLTVFHIVFAREHNWQADRLHALNPTWNDERLYQEARRIVGAEMQVVVFEEFLPALLGEEMPAYTGYKPNVNPGLSNAFATAAYRIGHSMVGPDIDLLNHNYQVVGLILLQDAFFNPEVIPNVGGPQAIVRYFSFATEQRIDTQIVDPLRNFLFGPPGAGGFDLAALNIQRGRDHGLADYNTLRQDYGLPRVTEFGQITSDPQLAASLEQLYSDVDDIDPWVGMLAEDHLPGASVGETHRVILMDQFLRLRDGDRFWYERMFPSQQAAALRATRLSDIFERTTQVAGLQDNVFYALERCYPDCDGDGVLTVADFGCFQTRYALAAPEADCDGDGVLSLADFGCFQTSFAFGCK